MRVFALKCRLDALNRFHFLAMQFFPTRSLSLVSSSFARQQPKYKQINKQMSDKMGFKCRMANIDPKYVRDENEKSVPMNEIIILLQCMSRHWRHGRISSDCSNETQAMHAHAEMLKLLMVLSVQTNCNWYQSLVFFDCISLQNGVCLLFSLVFSFCSYFILYFFAASSMSIDINQHKVLSRLHRKQMFLHECIQSKNISSFLSICCFLVVISLTFYIASIVRYFA